MSTQPAPSAMKSATPIWFWAASSLGLAWNLFGVAQFAGSLSATQETLVASGLTVEQASVMLGYPAWMTTAFAVGVFGGLFGCVLLLLRKRLSVPVFAVSLAGYALLFIGDITEGVFAAMGVPQVAILTSVVLIAVALFILARRSAEQGLIA